MDNLAKYEEKVEKHEKIRQILEKLSKSQTLLKNDENIKEYYIELSTVYCDKDFRHWYSEVFAYLTYIDDQENLSLDILSENIKKVYESCCLGVVEDTKGCLGKIEKLYDHVNLDISRINNNKMLLERNRELREHIDKINSDIEKANVDINIITEKSEKIQKDYETIAEKSEKIQKVYETIAEELEKIQRDYITILGIFASIVITFMAGVAFSSSILSNMKDVSIYRLILASIMVGLILTNSLGILTGFIERIGGFKDSNGHVIRNINIVLCALFVVLMVRWLQGFGY